MVLGRDAAQHRQANPAQVLDGVEAAVELHQQEAEGPTRSEAEHALIDPLLESCAAGFASMAQEPDDVAETEPVGIVISRGSRGDAEPKFSAYVWGPAPETVNEGASKAA